MYLMNQAKTGISAMALSRPLGVTITAWGVKHKLMQVMRGGDNNRVLSGIIPLDDVCWGEQNKVASEVEAQKTKFPLLRLFLLMKITLL